jgi:hypothetical protein
MAKNNKLNNINFLLNNETEKKGISTKDPWKKIRNKKK